MKVLFIGGTGRLSKDTAAFAVERGMDVTLLTRGSASRSLFVTKGCETLRGDIRKPDACRAALAGREFDVVVDHLTFNVSQLESTLGVIGGKCGQCVFVSFATVYEIGPEGNLSINRSTFLRRTDCGITPGASTFARRFIGDAPCGGDRPAIHHSVSLCHLREYAHPVPVGPTG